MHNVADFVFGLGLSNINVCRHIDGCGDVPERCDLDEKNFKGVILLEFFVEKELCVIE